MAFCKYCGSSISEQGGFCPECGKEIKTDVHSRTSVTTDDIPSRRDYFEVKASLKTKLNIRNCWVALIMAVILRVAVLPVNAVLMMPGIMRGQYLEYAFNGLIFSATGLCILLMFLACFMRHWGFAAIALLLAVYKAVILYTIPLAVGNIAILLAAILIFVHTRKLEKEYQGYIGSTYPGTMKK